MKFDVSIIVPVYNGEKYVERCIENLINQTYKNIEIILINDGSTDNTENVLKKYDKYNHVKIINQTNSGVSHSRNVGIENANGEYIWCVDSDDYVEYIKI